MDVVVCVKRVPDVTEVDLEITQDGKDIKREGLAYAINEWDSYALEEAIRIKEKFGGKVYAITVGSEDDEEVLRRALALGADEVIRIDCGFNLDAYTISKALSEVIKNLHYDIILTGVQSSDDGYAQVGPSLAKLLGIPHATLVTSMEIDGDVVKVHRELEGGMEEVLELKLPALFTIQTGINEPRYVSILGIRRVAKREIKVFSMDELGVSLDDCKVEVSRLFTPPVGEGAEIISGSPDEVAGKIVEILEKGGVI